MRRLKMMLALFFSLLLGCAPSPHTESPPQKNMESFLQTPSARKLSPSLQKRLRAMEANGAERLDLLLGLKGPPTETEKERLRREGALLRSVVGGVATATAQAEKIPAISRLDFVEAIELATPLKPKGEDDDEAP